MNPGSRSYSMVNRAAKAAATRERIRQSAIKLYRERPEDFSLKAVAAEAATTVQTVLRLFGSKAALIVLANEGRDTARRNVGSPDKIAAAVRLLYDGYEERGDTMGPPGEAERAALRRWIGEHLLTPLTGQTAETDPVLLFGLIVATDIATWRLLRRDLGLYRRAAEAVVAELIAGLLAARP